ncbi:Fic family protein [Pseudogracilibacillus auburnensis]|uniref:Fic family protein n=1 Tax=Pseudogracilibacillus auburnensis TaxID=1494959 RepID=A0A2V3VTP2_9BACI|nr:Fic family protein [Pseudogracilibacillus auburnensis]PXW83375.1 Fic family protein [Pseudogracilibacillus auburnensis]
MPREGVSKLPIGVPVNEALTIMEILSQVNLKLGRLEEKFNHSIVNQALVQILLLSESVESTRIEGTQVTFTDMVEEQNSTNQRWEIIEVHNYRRALYEGYERIRHGYPISSRLIKDLHEILMQDGRGSTQSSGQFRKVQNFIGPTNSIEDATYIPISADKIDEYMQNLEFFTNHHPYKQPLCKSHIKDDQYIFDENANPLIKTAIIHAQFESIHPFLDGNGRLGRILIVLSFIQSKIISQPIFFVSEELEKERARYYDMLNGVRGNQPNWADWILFFLNACNRMADRIHSKLENADELAKSGISQLKLESEKNVWLYTFSDPFTTAKKVSEKLNISSNTARNSLNKLVEKKLLFTDSEAKRNKKYRNYDLMRILRD